MSEYLLDPRTHPIEVYLTMKSIILGAILYIGVWGGPELGEQMTNPISNSNS